MKNNLDYKFNEGALIEELQAYIDDTYGGHYSKNNFQSTEFIVDCGHGIGFTIGNIFLLLVMGWGMSLGAHFSKIQKKLNKIAILIF